MSDHPNIDDLRARIKHLDLLLADPHPGLFTWREAYGKAAEQVLEFFKDQTAPAAFDARPASAEEPKPKGAT